MLEKIERLFKKKINQKNLTYELKGTYAAILATDGFEESELTMPRESLENAGCKTQIVSLTKARIKGWKDNKWGKSISVDLTVEEAQDLEFDFLVLPGGVLSTDKLRVDQDVISFVKSFLILKRPVAAICHGVQTLIETELLEGRNLTSWPSLKTDLLNAGANWSNRQVVVDHKLITARGPFDLPAFIQEMRRVFEYGRINHAIPNTESFVTIR